MLYIGVSKNAEHRGIEHNTANGKTAGWTQQYILVSRVADCKVLGELKHEILHKSSQLTDSLRFKNDMPGGGYNPINKRPGDVHLLWYAGQFDSIQAASKPKDFSGGPSSFKKSSKLEYPPLTLPKIKEPLSVHKALRMIGYVFEETIEKIRDAPYKCDFCSSSFFMKHHLKEHLNIHMPDAEKCTMCKFTTKYHANMRTHMELVHQTKMEKKSIKSLNYHCQFCGEKFDNSQDLQSHRRIHKVGKCQYCGREMKKAVS